MFPSDKGVFWGGKPCFWASKPWASLCRCLRRFFPRKNRCSPRTRVCFGVGNHVFGPQNHGRRCAGASGGFSPRKIGVPLGQGCVLGVSGPIFKLQAPFWGVVLFWTPFSEKMLQNHCVLLCLGAGWNLKPDQPDQADPPDPPDPPEMVHIWQFAP